MTYPLSLANFAVDPIPPNGVVVPFQDNDIIVLVLYDRADANSVGLRLQSKQGMYFKGIEVHGGGQVSKLEVDGGGAVTQEISIPAHLLNDTTLIFVKGKIFNIHTPMYHMPASELAPHLGRGIVFDWRQD
jgi:hypothetical protein